MSRIMTSAPEMAVADTDTVKGPIQRTVFSVLLAISFSHLLNDTMQSLIPSTYPLLKKSLNLNFSQLGLVTFCFQLTASLLQPFVGLYTDKRPKPFSLAAGMCFTLGGLILLSKAGEFAVVLIAVALIGMGSAVFHPEASRLAWMASGGRRGMAQSIFQLGGNAGSSLGPLLAAELIAPYANGQSRIAWFALFALLAIAVLVRIGVWYRHNLNKRRKKDEPPLPALAPGLSQTRVLIALCILRVLLFSKSFYLASMSSYYTFFLMDKFHVSISASQMLLFLYLFAIAAGTLIGGHAGDRFGRKYVIWFSILGAAPFTLLLPYVNLFWTAVLSFCVGVIIASAFSAILVYAQELVPGKIGLISGLFFGLAFGMGGIGAAVLGRLADRTSIQHVFHLCSFLPLLGLLTGFLPSMKPAQHHG
ncbi:MAG TPA: MFS transporter [Puia sp.]|nr:MFS transporter [Puia sp.]